jgi:alpha-D-ribose 1-methylphosphonate 5-triphosphate synthase subunit PhnH
MSIPPYTAQEARARETFLALMGSLSYPGRIHSLPASGNDAFAAIAEALLDLETSYSAASDPDLLSMLARTGARALPPETAAYHFHQRVDAATLTMIDKASAGTLLYPDQSATLILGAQIGVGVALTLKGPGIKGAPQIVIGGIPAAFWSARARACQFPLGWDIFLVDGASVIGLPRSTTIEIDTR